ncbi:MAG: Ig domain-containing protein [candidate division KSB1 bacterium]|nr:Ig domain-containing protein [candidate division KSB1 bacterium]
MLVDPPEQTTITLVMQANFPIQAPGFNLPAVNYSTTGKYVLVWSSTLKSSNYRLEESTDSTFTQTSAVYTGADTSVSLNKNTDAVYFYRVRGENEIGFSPWSQWIKFIVSIKPELLILTDSLPGGTVNQPYSQTLEAEGGHEPYTWTLIEGALPAGLTLEASTGQISGTPSVAGDYAFILQIADNSDLQQTDTLSLSITISPATLQILTGSLQTGTLNASFSQILTASGGTEPYTWSVTAGSLPDGLILDAASGKISGASVESGLFQFTIQVTDNSEPQQSASVSLSIAIQLPALQILTSALANGNLNSDYSQVLSATGGTEPYTWSVTAGGLPDGLILDAASGEISGASVESGLFQFTIQVTDNSETQQSDTRTLSIQINPTQLEILTQSLADGQVGTAYSGSLIAGGGIEPYTWSLNAGILPDGLTLDASSGQISGTPASAGTFNFTVQVNDNSDPQQSDSKTFLSPFQHPNCSSARTNCRMVKQTNHTVKSWQPPAEQAPIPGRLYQAHCRKA